MSNSSFAFRARSLTDGDRVLLVCTARVPCSEFDILDWLKLVRSGSIPESESESESTPEGRSQSRSWNQLELHRLRSPATNIGLFNVPNPYLRSEKVWL